MNKSIVFWTLGESPSSAESLAIELSSDLPKQLNPDIEDRDEDDELGSEMP